MTREERKAEEKARLARVAVRTLAQLAAKNEVKRQIRASGQRLWDYTNREIVLRAEKLLEQRPELVVEARAKAASLGYG